MGGQTTFSTGEGMMFIEPFLDELIEKLNI